MPIAFTVSALRDPLAAAPEARRLYWAMATLGFALLPHLFVVPAWVPLLIATTALWRITIEVRVWRLPPRWLRLLIAVGAMMAVAFTYRTLNGLDAGTALLAAMAGVKLLETRGVRDCTMLIFIGFVLLFAALLYDQSLLRLPYILGAALLLTLAWLRLHQTAMFMSTRTALSTTGALLVQALPLAVLLFVFFPRLPGQFWALPARSSAMTGLSDEMAPGDITQLTISDDPAFRVKFEGPMPPPAERYWRGPVLHDFDGRRWRREMNRAVPNETVIGEGSGYRYRITIEPTQRPWLLALDVPTRWPDTALQFYDLQLLTRQPITAIASFELQSHTRFRTSPRLSHTLRTIDTALPHNANPRTHAFAQQLRAAVTTDLEYVQAILNAFRTEEFYYTLTPPPLGEHAVDDFLFTTRRGFCEHFASAFTVLARAAGIPARVVTGYQGGEYNAMGDYLLVRQSDAHAWSEVWLEGRGWTRIDPTAAVAPQRIERNLDAALSQTESVPGRFLRQNPFLSRARLVWDAINNFWNDRIVQYNELKQRALLQSLGVDSTSWRELGIIFAVMLATFFVALSVYLSWHYRSRKRAPVVATYEKLCRKLARAQLQRAPHEGPNDYLERAAAARPELAPVLHEVRVLYNELRYGPAPSDRQLHRLRSLVNKVAA